jgi:hypothetical protein
LSLVLDSGYASKPKNLAFAACGYLQGITVPTIPYHVKVVKNMKWTTSVKKIKRRQ